MSVFETNIRIVGGLIGAHFMASMLKHDERIQPRRMQWYNSELVGKVRRFYGVQSNVKSSQACEIADRLLPAFNTTSGLPHPRVNLRHGVTKHLAGQHETCTACAGTMILEWATLTRLSGKKLFCCHFENIKMLRAMQITRKSQERLWTSCGRRDIAPAT